MRVSLASTTSYLRLVIACHVSACLLKCQPITSSANPQATCRPCGPLLLATHLFFIIACLTRVQDAWNSLLKPPIVSSFCTSFQYQFLPSTLSFVNSFYWENVFSFIFFIIFVANCVYGIPQNSINKVFVKVIGGGILA